MTIAKWKTHIGHSHKQSCFTAANSSTHPSLLFCCIALGNEDYLRIFLPLLWDEDYTNTLKKRTVYGNRTMLFCTGSHHRDVLVSTCRNIKISEKLETLITFCRYFTYMVSK